MKKTILYTQCIAVLVALTCLFGCTEDIDESSRYVFKERTVLDYLNTHEQFSEYVKLLGMVHLSPISSTTVRQILSARGHYTVFAPTNEAIQEYLDSLAVKEDFLTAPSWNAFTDSVKLDSIRQVVVLSSIIDNGDNEEAYETSRFPQTVGGEFPRATMNDRKLAIYRVDPDAFFVNKDCPISMTVRDIMTLNGIVHQMEKAIVPTNQTANMYLSDMLEHQTEGYLVLARAIQACGLMDTLNKVRDERYETLYQEGKIPNLVGMANYGFAEDGTAWVPEHRKYGFTIFAEPDDFWRGQGLDPKNPDVLQDLVQWIVDNHQYSDDDQFTTDSHYDRPENLLYQWLTYHILPMKIPANKLVFHVNETGITLSGSTTVVEYGVPVYEYYTSFGKRRLIKLYESRQSHGVYLNRFPKLDKARNGTGQEIGCDPDKTGARIGNDDSRAVLAEMVNCNIYPIDRPLSYNDEVRDNLHKDRMRFDYSALFPEFMNNDIRKKEATDERYQYVHIPKTSVYPYLDDMQTNDQCNYAYYNAYGYEWPNLHADEHKIVGHYELTFRFPPVPRRGTYELRYVYLPDSKRGVAQMYFGSNPDRLPVTGIPLDLRIEDKEKLGYVDDEDDDEFNAENDKKMHNNGYMRGPMGYGMLGEVARAARYRTTFMYIRRVVTRLTMDPDETYYFKIKSVLDDDHTELQMDCMELCPKEVYDNPAEPEDIW